MIDGRDNKVIRKVLSVYCLLIVLLVNTDTSCFEQKTNLCCNEDDTPNSITPNVICKKVVNIISQKNQTMYYDWLFNGFFNLVWMPNASPGTNQLPTFNANVIFLL